MRIQYIDNIKGFAIFLVVMGHVIANWYPDYSVVLSKQREPDDMILWKFIYSFHMPLFMFCSGLFQPVITRGCTARDFGLLIVRRFKTLMIPYMVSGILLLCITGRYTFYWYLLFLFVFIVVNGSLSFSIKKLPPPYSQVAEIMCFACVTIAIKMLTSRFEKIDSLILPIGNLNLYKYFTAAYLLSKYKLVERMLNNNNYIYPASLILVVSLFIVETRRDCTLLPGASMIVSVSAIYAVFYFFRNNHSDNMLLKFMNILGRHSLEIYVCHFFFLFKTPFVGDIIHKISLSAGTRSDAAIFIIGLIASVVISLYIICLCFLFMQIIGKSTWLYRILFGRVIARVPPRPSGHG